MHDLRFESLLRIDQSILNPQEHQELMKDLHRSISKLLTTTFAQSKDKSDAGIQVVEILERFFSQGKNSQLVDYLLAEIFETYEPDVKLLSEGKPDRIVAGLFTLKVIQPIDFIFKFADLRTVKDLSKILAGCREWICLV